MNHSSFFLCIALCLLCVSTDAQVSYTSGTYTQDFNALANSGASNTWTDNSTLPGWYAAGSFGGTYAAGTGSNDNGDLYSFGTASGTDRALGSVASGGTGTMRFGLEMTNQGSTTLTAFTTSFDGEQWRRGSNDPQRTESLSFSYQIFASGSGSLTASSGWTTLPSLTFTSPNATVTSSSALNGNDTANTLGMNASINSISWAPGQELWFRWTDTNDTGFDHGLAIDNFTFSAIPEPSTLLLFGLAIALATLGRRSRHLNSQHRVPPKALS